MSRKYTIEEVREQIESVPGYKLLSTEYKDSHTKIEVLCPVGHIYQVKRNCWQQGDRCRLCGFKIIAQKKTKPIEERVQKVVKEKRVNPRKLTTEYVKDFVKQRGFTLLNEYTGSSNKILLRCPNNHEIAIAYGSFQQGRGCLECSTQIKRGTNYVKNRTKKRIGSESNKSPVSYDPKHHEWRKLIYAKFNYTCQKCSFSGRSGNRILNAHHIESYTKNESLRYDLENGICLCNRCHTIFHRTYGFKGFTRADLEDYLSAESNP
jgi:hypothetical protein